MLEISAALKLDPTFFLNLCGSSVFIVHCLLHPQFGSATIKALKLGKYCANKYLWYIGNKFFTTMANCSFSLSLLIISAALALHLVMKVENDSFGSSLVVSRSLLVKLLVDVLPISFPCIIQIDKPPKRDSG